LSIDSVLSRARRWFSSSGIQETSGGVARYYRADLERNHSVSTEITGYGVSTFLFLDCPEQAAAAARFLTRQARNSHPIPFEIDPASFTYFFDCGIIVRGLVAAWRMTGETEYLEAAAATGQAMRTEFLCGDGEYHPVLMLPGKTPAARDARRWSQCPGCYQLKAGLGWWELFEATGEPRFREAYQDLLDWALRSYRSFLPGDSDPRKVVDRLHAFLYFLEGLLPQASSERCRLALCEGIQLVACHLQRTAHEFERSDVYAQLLRMRVFADRLGIVPLDRAGAVSEAAALAGFQASSTDERIDGGFYFGRQQTSWLPFINPVSTAFAAQALALWRDRSSLPEASQIWHRLI
jgi:hypothetical protein